MQGEKAPFWFVEMIVDTAFGHYNAFISSVKALDENSPAVRAGDKLM